MSYCTFVISRIPCNIGCSWFCCYFTPTLPGKMLTMCLFVQYFNNFDYFKLNAVLANRGFPSSQVAYQKKGMMKQALFKKKKATYILQKANKVSTKQTPFVHSVVSNSILSRSVGVPQRAWDGSNTADWNLKNSSGKVMEAQPCCTGLIQLENWT